MKTRGKAMCCAILSGVAMLMTVTAMAQSDDDKKFLATAAQSDVNEIKLSQLAEEKATNPAVKAFAHKMVVEHTKMSEGMKPFAESWGVTLPTGLDDDHQKEYDKLNGLSGADFDKEYIDQMVSDHAKALSAFTTEAKDTKDVKFRGCEVPRSGFEGQDNDRGAQEHGLRSEKETLITQKQTSFPAGRGGQVNHKRTVLKLGVLCSQLFDKRVMSHKDCLS